MCLPFLIWIHSVKFMMHIDFIWVHSFSSTVWCAVNPRANYYNESIHSPLTQEQAFCFFQTMEEKKHLERVEGRQALIFQIVLNTNWLHSLSHRLSQMTPPFSAASVTTSERQQGEFWVEKCCGCVVLLCVVDRLVRCGRVATLEGQCRHPG